MVVTMENLIFGIMVVIMIGAGFFTFIYETCGKSERDNDGMISENSKEGK
jgi:hypothetical protein